MAEVKRGFRKVTMVLPVKAFDQLTRLADENDREVGQQAASMVKSLLRNQATLDERLSGAWGEDDNGVVVQAEEATVE